MVQVGEIQWNVAGDIGGRGVSRFRFTRQDSGSLTGADVAAAASASSHVISSVSAFVPTDITWSCNAEVNVYDMASGLVSQPFILTSPPTNVVGGATGSYGAGLGGRVNWKTATLSGRRLLKGATFLVPFGQAAFTSGGAIQSACLTASSGGISTYLTNMATALLEPVIWHRPSKGTTTGGLVGVVYAGALSAIPAGLRSRRS